MSNEYEFDEGTGFILTKARKKKLPKKEIQVKKESTQIEPSIIKTSILIEPTIVIPKESSSITLIPNTINEISITNNLDMGGKVLGVRAYRTLLKIRGAIEKIKPSKISREVPNHKKLLANSFQGREDEKESDRRADESYRESKEQTSLLEKILDKVGLSRSSKGGLLDGLGSKGGIFQLPKINIKSLLKKLGVAGLVYSVFDKFGDSINDYKEKNGIAKNESLTLSQKVGYATSSIANMFSDTVRVLSLGMIDLWSEEEVNQVVESFRKVAVAKFDQFKQQYPQIGKAIEGLGEGLSNFIGAIPLKLETATTWIKDTSINGLDYLEKNMPIIKKSIGHLGNGLSKFLDTMADTLSVSYDYWFGDTLDDLNKKRNSLLAKKSLSKEEKIELREIEAQQKKKYKSRDIDKKEKLDDDLSDLLDLKLDINNGSKMAYSKMVLLHGSENTLDEKIKRKTFESKHFTKMIEGYDKEEVREDKYSKYTKHKEGLETSIKSMKTQKEDFEMKLLNAKTEEEKKHLISTISVFTKNIELFEKQIVSLREPVKETEPYPSHVTSSKYGSLLETISKGEGTSDSMAKRKGYASGYDVTLNYGAYADDKSKALSTMTIREVKELQGKMLSHKDNNFNSSASGKYQITRENLLYLQKKLGVSDDEIFSPNMQDRMATDLIMSKRGGKNYFDGKITKTKFIKNLGYEWDSIAVNKENMNARDTHVAKTKYSTINKAILDFEKAHVSQKEVTATRKKGVLSKTDSYLLSSYDQQELEERLAKGEDTSYYGTPLLEAMQSKLKSFRSTPIKSSTIKTPIAIAPATSTLTKSTFTPTKEATSSLSTQEKVIADNANLGNLETSLNKLVALTEKSLNQVQKSTELPKNPRLEKDKPTENIMITIDSQSTTILGQV